MPILSKGAQARLLAILMVGAIVAFFLALVYTGGSLTLKTNCVIDTSWSSWGTCSRNCGGGWQFRSRGIAKPPSNGGRACDSDQMLDSQSCNTDVPCGLDCIAGNPNTVPWGPCPSCMRDGEPAVQSKVVPPFREATEGGRDCALSEVFYVRSCSSLMPCPADADCVIDPTPSYVTPCSEPCGGGVQLAYHTVSTPPSGNGIPCDWSQIMTTQECNSQSCACGDSNWPDVWGECSVACGPGIQFQTRVPANDDDRCPLVRSQTCTVTSTCTVPAGKTTCDAPSADFVQVLCYMKCAQMPLPSYPLSVTDATGATSVFCSVSEDMMNSVCGAGAWDGSDCAAPQNCEVSTWSSWSACSLPQCDSNFVGGGISTRVRTITQLARYGGKPCSDYLLLANMPCNTLQDVTYSSLSYVGGTGSAADPQDYALVAATLGATCIPVDCSFSALYPLGPCTNSNGFSCGTCTQTWARSVSTFPSGGGAPCIVPDGGWTSLSSQVLNCPGCSWTDWTLYFADNADVPGGGWSSCSSNYDGTMTATRTMTYRPATADPNDPTCAPTNAFTQSSCCVGGICSGSGESPCPRGCGNQVCSNHGTCNTFTSSVNLLSGSCSCFSGFAGDACEFASCPLGYNGLPCSGLGTCNSYSDNGWTTYTSLTSFTCACPNGDTSPNCQNSARGCIIRASSGLSSAQGGSGIFNVPVPLGFIALDGNFSADHCRLLNSLETPAANSVAFVSPTSALFFGQTSQAWTLNHLQISGELTQGMSSPYATMSAAAAAQFCNDGLAQSLSAWTEAGWPALASWASLSTPPPNFSELQRLVVPGSIPATCWSLDNFTALLN